MKNVVRITLAGFLSVTSTCSLIGQAGSLDPTFGVNGIETSDLTCNEDQWAYSMIQQPDGKLLITGYCSGQFVARYLSDGSLDTSFGLDGIVTTGFGIGGFGFPASAGAIGLQPDGKVLVTGHYYNGQDIDFALMRLNSNGTIDTAFGTSGTVVTSIDNYNDQSFGIAVQSDGKILVIGSSGVSANNKAFALARYNQNGALDSSFNGDGKATTTITSGTDIAFAVSIQADGMILLAGTCTSGGNSDMAVVRYHPNGDLDTGFDSDGIVQIGITPNEDDAAVAMVLQGDGKVVVCGSTQDGPMHAMAAVRLNNDGSLDTTFGNGGVVTTDFGGTESKAYALCVQPDNKIVIGGFAGVLPGWDWHSAMVRYAPDGVLDSTFGLNGIVVSPFSTYSEIRGLALEADLKIITAGFTVDTTTVTGYDVAISRYFSGLSIGIAEFSSIGMNTTIYPNPVADMASFEYELCNVENLSCELFDAQGRSVRSFFANVPKPSGKHVEAFDLRGLAAGTYSIILSNGEGYLSIQVVKE